MSVEFDPVMFEKELTQAQRDLYDIFINEYMRDSDPYKAAIRTGFQQVFALDWANRLMGEGYVRRGIAYMQRKPTPEQEQKRIIEEDRALIENNLRELIQNGSSASRVSAIRLLAEIRGIAKPEGSNDALTELNDVLRDFAKVAPA